VPSPTPEEAAKVCAFALQHPQAGYKRLAWQMVDEDVVYLRPYQVYRILIEHDLLSRRTGQKAALKRPPEPERPDQVWHIDLLYLFIRPNWYYLVDILDGYSRFLVNWSLNVTMTADTVTLTVQEALETLEHHAIGEPVLIHDRVQGVGLTDVRTRVSHPQSNGRLERLHRTHREEGLPEETLTSYYEVLDRMEEWSYFYNHRRTHSALQYLRPIDYYRGDPAARKAERERKLAQGIALRETYWKDHGRTGAK